MNKYFSTIVLCFALCVPALAVEKPTFNFTQVNVSQVIHLIYSEVLPGSYVIDPDVIADQRVVTFRYADNKRDTRAFVASFLDSLGLDVETRGGVDFIAKKKPDPEIKPEKVVFVYRPKNRDANTLSRILAPLFPVGSFTDQRSIPASLDSRVTQQVPEKSAAALVDQSVDVLVFHQKKADIDQLIKILPLLDVPPGEVVIRSVLYEVTQGKSDGSTFKAVVSLLGSRLGLTTGTSLTSTSDQFKLSTGSFDAVLGVLNSDSSLRSLTSPTLRIRSGSTGRFSVGEKVPTLGAVTQTAAGSSLQSVVYQSAGVILDLSPVVRDDAIDLTIKQQVSSFAATTTGVNGSPTQSVREVQTSVSVSDGEIVLLGGLDQSSASATHQGASFLPAWMRSSASSDARTELLLLLQVKRLGAGL